MYIKKIVAASYIVYVNWYTKSVTVNTDQPMNSWDINKKIRNKETQFVINTHTTKKKPATPWCFVNLHFKSCNWHCFLYDLCFKPHNIFFEACRFYDTHYYMAHITHPHIFFLIFSLKTYSYCVSPNWILMSGLNIELNVCNKFVLTLFVGQSKTPQFKFYFDECKQHNNINEKKSRQVKPSQAQMSDVLTTALSAVVMSRPMSAFHTNKIHKMMFAWMLSSPDNI